MRRRVVSAARKGGVVLVLHIHFDFPVAAVTRLVRGGIAYCVLAAQLFGDLIESLLQIFLVAHDNHSAAGFVATPWSPPSAATRRIWTTVSVRCAASIASCNFNLLPVSSASVRMIMAFRPASSESLSWAAR